jgi:PqqA peptide cyclase
MDNPPRPYTLVAELTYACPLQCPYCANAVDAPVRDGEIDTAAWIRALREAEALGVVQVNLTGGEPLLRDDLDAVISHAARLGLYTNLITSGIPLTRERLAALQQHGLDNVQLSLQSLETDRAADLAGGRFLEQKRHAIAWVKELGLPLTLNFVLHRHNIDETPRFISFAESVGADRLELANAQYLGWALRNRDALLPGEEQIRRARTEAHAAGARLKGRMEIVFVMPDYYAEFPKTCMNGWGRSFLVITPDGTVLPCHLARTIPALRFENVRDSPLHEIWFHSDGFNRFRGEAWMSEPCRGCERRHLDFGGCRCQAFHVAGDAAAADPACSRSPHHSLIQQAGARAATASPVEFAYRRYGSRR